LFGLGGSNKTTFVECFIRNWRLRRSCHPAVSEKSDRSVIRNR
jgi:hypothetical protein